MDRFSGSTNLWRLLREYELLIVLFGYCKGPLSGSYGSEIGQNCMKYDIWALFEHFCFKEIEMNPFSGSTNFWRLLVEYEPFNILCW